MKKVFSLLLLASIPVLLMLQVLQSYRYVLEAEEISVLEKLQEDRLEENRKLMASIAVFNSPERLYRVASETLGLSSPGPENVVLVRFPDAGEEKP
ncbi:MAG: cell division protein FtsL [Spirochaetales bacterium]|nr:MAG: cell division protein FtsL [Spirochaetales bacterium]